MGSVRRGFVHDLFDVEWARFDARFGLRAALVFLVPVAVGLLLNNGIAGVLVALGTLNLLLTANPRPAATKLIILEAAAPVSALCFGVGTLLAVLPESLEVVGIAVVIFGLLYLFRFRIWQPVGLTASVMVCIGAGLAPPPVAFPGADVLLVALGGVWGLLAFAVSQRARLRDATGLAAPPSAPEISRSQALEITAPYAALVAVTVGLGLAIGLGLGLPRDFWIMVTILVALRPDLASTTSYAGMRILGTIAGAGLAFFVTVYISDVVGLFLVLAFAAFLTFASRGVNYAFYAVWITLLVITLLDLVFAGGPSLAVVRIIDTLIGGGLALVSALLLAAAIYRRPFAPARQTV